MHEGTLVRNRRSDCPLGSIVGVIRVHSRERPQNHVTDVRLIDHVATAYPPIQIN